MPLLSLLLLLSMGSPQSYELQPLTPDQARNGLLAYQAQNAGRQDRIQVDRVQTGSNVCFAIRSYIFKRQDGNAPELAGTITCTPAETLQQKQVRHPRARLVPAN